MNPKTRADAKWNQLTKEQRRLLEEWLFEEGTGYKEALARAQKEFGYGGSRSSLQRFVERVKVERMERGFIEAAALMKRVDEAAPAAEALQQAAVKLASQQLLRDMAASPGDAKKWLPLAKWLAQMARNSSWERVKNEENLVRMKNLQVSQDRFEHKTMERVLKALPELNLIARKRQDPAVADREEDAMINWGRRKLFGNVPLTPQEEADVAAYEEKCRRRREEYRLVPDNIGYVVAKIRGPALKPKVRSRKPKVARPPSPPINEDESGPTGRSQ